MGSSYTNLQVRSRDFDGVVRALQECNVLPVYVSRPCDKGWISIYPRATERQDEKTLKSIAADLSKALDAGVFGLLVHDSDLFFYVLCENGKLTDEYESDPGYFDGANVAPSGGNMQAVVRYCMPGTTIKELSDSFSKKPNRVTGTIKFFWHLFRKDFDKAFSSTSIFRGDTLARNFGEKLGLPHERVSVGYKYIKQGEGDIAGLTLFRNEAEDLARAQGKSGPPALMTEFQHQMQTVKDPAVRARYDQFGSMVHENQVGTGEELNWYGTIKNDGGYSQGIRFTVESEALEQGMFEHVKGSVERWQSRSDEESDYEEPDADDETFWPFIFDLQPTDLPTVWSADVPDFIYSTEFLARLPIVPSEAGSAKLKVSIEPLDPSGSSTANFNVAMKVEVSAHKESVAPKPAKTHDLGTFKMTLPGQYGVTSQEGKGLMAMMGVKFELRAFKGYFTQMNVSIQTAGEEGSAEQTIAEQLAEQLKQERQRRKARDFTASAVEKIDLPGVEIELARWETGKLIGISALGRIDQGLMVIRAETSDLESLQEINEAILSLARKA